MVSCSSNTNQEIALSEKDSVVISSPETIAETETDITANTVQIQEHIERQEKPVLKVESKQEAPGNLESQKNASPPKQQTLPDLSDIKRAEALIQGSDCESCHQLNETFIGPSYHEIANKYQNDFNKVAYLAGRIRAGGSGNWGDTPMTPHMEMPLPDAMRIAAYILSLKE